MSGPPTHFLALLLATVTLAAADPQVVVADCDTAAPACGWTVSWQSTGTTFATPGDDRAAARIVNAHNGVGFLEREVVLAGKGRLRLLRFVAQVDVENATGRGAGLNVSVIGDDGTALSHHDMGYGDFGLVGGTRRQPAELTVVLPAEAARARIGLILYGPGMAEFDAVRAEVRAVDDAPPSAFARAYVDEAIAHVRRHALVRDELDFEALAREAYRIAGSARTAPEAYPAIRHLLERLGDHHSFFMSREEKSFWQGAGATAPVAAAPMPGAKNLDGIGYIAVPGFHGDAAQRKSGFAQAIQDGLRDLSSAGVRGWVVDLRDNDGGNMYPMLAGLAPLFDASVLGYLVDADGRREPWGVAGPGEEGFVAVARPFAPPRRLPVAVLYGPRTGSSGEIVVLSFVGNALTRSFGQPSFGLTTGNGTYPLSDGSELRLASTRMADRSGRVHEGPVQPDELVVDAQGSDAVLVAALAWLRAQARENQRE